jgi:hypothetical protein
MELRFIPLSPDSIDSHQKPSLNGGLSEVYTPDEEPIFKTEGKGFSFLSFEPTISNSGKVRVLEAKKEEKKIEFQVNLNLWLGNNSLLANNNYDDSNFKEIVEMREDAVPLILEELHKGPTPLVHALDLIYPGEVEYDGYIPLEAICSLWEAILTGKETR